MRLLRGDMDAATVYSDDPAAQARVFFEAGCPWLHVVDLDGAFAGTSSNRVAIEAIRAAVPGMQIQLGGGIRSLAAMEGWLSAGITRVILGTVAARDPQLVHEACRQFPGRIVVGIDARGGKVAVEGWAETSQLTALELASRFEGAGVSAIIYTDIDRDGTLSGVNLAETRGLAEQVAIPVIASGGVGKLEDIQVLVGSGLAGVVVGKALYDGRVALQDALSLLGMR